MSAFDSLVFPLHFIYFTALQYINWRKKLPWMIFEEQFPVPKYTAASKIGNSVISLLWQLDAVATLIITNFHLYLIQLWWQFFPKLCLWRPSLFSNLGGIGLEKLYRATLSNSSFRKLFRNNCYSCIQFLNL